MLYLLLKNIIRTSVFFKKSVLLSLVCLFLPFFSYSQNILSDFFQKIEEKYQAAQIDSALQFLAEADPLLETNAQKAQWKILKAKCLLQQEGPTAAQPFLAQAQGLLEIPDDDLLLAEIYNIRGSMAMRENKLTQAEKWYTQALGIRETYLGPESDKVADTYNNLGALYYRKQQYDEALLMHQQALTIRQKILKAPHPDLGTSYNNLAACYYDLGYLEEAIQYNQRALEQRLQSFGSGHPSVADSYNNLGNCYFDLYDLTQAITQHQKALELRQSLGDSKGVADSYNNLGNCWLENGDYTQATSTATLSLGVYSG
jgi:tetratricopeptide (TPR) repeat protein